MHSGCGSTQPATDPVAEASATDDVEGSVVEVQPTASDDVGIDDVVIDDAGVGDVEVARVADALDQQLVQQVIACRKLADNSIVSGFYATQDKPHRALNALRDTVRRSSALVASLVDANGVVTLSTDPNAEGYEFSRWGFFQSGLAGDVLAFPAVGFFAETRSLYVIVPHENAEGERTGVVVLRSSVSPLDGLLDGLQAPAALVYRDRYALATNRPDLGFHGLRRLDQRGATIDFDDGELFDVLDAVVPAIGDTFTENGIVYAIERIPMVVPDWTLLVARAQSGAARTEY